MRTASRIVIFAAVVSASGVTSPTAAQPASPDPDAGVRVMSFNIRYGTARDGANAWPNRRELVLGVIRAFEPDVLGVQEALDFQVDELQEAFPGFEALGVGRDDGARRGEFAALLVRSSRFEIVEGGTFWFSDAPGVAGSASWGNRIPRICTWARVRDRATDRTFYVYNLHWDHESQPSRERSAGLLLEKIAGRSHPGDPVLVMGDFNAGETNPAFRTLVGARDPGLRDTFRDVHPEATEVGTFNGFEGRRDGEKIDAILASEGWCTRSAAIVRSARGGRYPSDHFPVTAEVRMGGSTACT